MHKTGVSLPTSTVLLHNVGLIHKLKVHSTINLMQTTSASYLLMCDLDYVRQKLVLEGYAIFDKLLLSPRKAYYHYLQTQDTVILNATDDLSQILVLDKNKVKI